MKNPDNAEDMDDQSDYAPGLPTPSTSGTGAADDILNECFNDPKRQRQLQRYARFLLVKDASETGMYGCQTSLVSSISSILSATFAHAARVPEMVTKLRETVAKEGLTAHDVYPDGNCLFAAVVDQMRVRADFSWSASTLRQQAVEYLRLNPTQPTGTHLQDFLIDETWDHYLTRMSEDGEWGDHIVIGAISEVVQKPIVILGSISGQGRAVVKPRRLLKNTTVQGEFTNTLETKHVAEDREGTPSVCPAKDSSKGDADEDVVKEDCLFLGHFAESHYVSLRHSNWKTKLQECMTKRSRNATQNKITRITEEHLDFMLRYIRNLGLVCRQDKKNTLPKLLDDMSVTHEGYTIEYNGPAPEGLSCYIKPFSSPLPTTELLFQNEVTEQRKPFIHLLKLNVPHDTIVLQESHQDTPGTKDLIANHNSCRLGYLRLFPLTAQIWADVIATTIGEEGAIRILDVKVCKTPETSVLQQFFYENEGDLVTFKELFSFRSQWPRIAAEWLTRVRSSGWPSAEVIGEIEKYGCTVEGNFLHDSKYPNTEWKYNFAIAEKLLARKYITKSQRYCFWLMTLLIDRFGHKGLTHDHLRTVFFYTCESIPVADWDRSPGSCLVEMLNKLQMNLQKKCLPHYFMPTVNTLKMFSENALSTMESAIAVLVHNIILAVYFLFDDHGHMLSNLCLMMDAVFDDLQGRLQGNGPRDPLFPVFIPESLQMIQSCLLMDDVATAGIVFTEEILESELALVDKSQAQLTRLFREAVAWADTIHAWCLAFSLVEEYGTAFVRVVNKNQSTVPLATIFGEEFVQKLNCTDLTVPKVCVDEPSFSIFEFVRNAAKLLVDQNECDVVILGLRYFLEKSGYVDEDVIGKVEQLVDNGTRGRKRSKSNCSTAFDDLKNIYSHLCTACMQTDRKVCFRDHMDIFERLCWRYKSVTLMNFVAQLWKDFKCHNKADAVMKRVQENVRTAGIILL